MRAILLTKDKEGINQDRLKGRYGLTGKPAISKEGVAGALGTSFKAGQQVTMNNLRSLNSKLKEAQTALNNASNNIDKTDETQDKVEDTVNKIKDLLSVGAWEQLWRGQMDPVSFFATMYQNDRSIQVMAGEPGYSVVNAGYSRSVAPIPRTPYWDPLLVYGKIGDADTDTSLRMCLPEYVDVLDSFSGQLSAKVIAYAALVSAFGSSFSLVTKVNSFCFAFTAMATPLNLVLGILSAGVTTMYYIKERLKKFQVDSNYTTKALRVKSYGGSFPNMYRYNFGQLEMLLYNYINSILIDAITNVTIQTAVLSAATAMTFTGIGLSSNPFTAIAGIVLQSTAAIMVGVVATFSMSIMVNELAFLFSIYSSQLSFTNCENTIFSGWPEIIKRLIGAGYDSRFPQRFIDSYSPLFKNEMGGSNSTLTTEGETGLINGSNSGSLIVGTSGIGTQFDYDGLFFTQPDFVSKLMVVISLLSPISITINAILDIVSPAPNVSKFISSTKINSNSSEVRLGKLGGVYSYASLIDEVINGKSYFKFQDWFGLSQIAINSKVNDVVSKFNSVISFHAGGINTDDIRMYARVYNGNLFKKRWFKKSIDKTVVIVSKAHTNNIFDGDGLWYGFMVLVRFTGESKLYLAMERNAQYFTNYHIRHIEQMIYNFQNETKALPMDKPFTEDRRGKLEYFYVEDEVGGVKQNIQFRNVKGEGKTNYLNNEALNTEYDFNGYIDLTTSPMNGWSEGGVDSYCSG